MRLLDRYLLRELLIPFSYCLIGFLVFWISSDVFTQLSDFQKYRLKLLDVVELYFVRMPEMLVTVLPVAFLLALLYTLTNHARHHELTAIRAAGVSLLRLSVPYLGFGILLSLAVFALNELWVPQSLDAADEILARRDPRAGQSAHSQWENKMGYYNDQERRWWLVESFNLATGDMSRPHIIWLKADGSRMDLLAEGGGLSDGSWTFTNVHVLVHSGVPGAVPDQTESDTLSMPEFKETLEQIRIELRVAKLNNFKSVRKTQLSVKEILEYKRLNPKRSNRSDVLDTKLHGRLAAPWACVVVVLIALPFGVATGRRNVVVGVASSILICFVYFVLQQLALALGTGGYVLPWVAAWAPNLFFAVTGLTLIWRVR